MELLVLGDLHLGEDDLEARPRSSWNRFDAVLVVGDVAHSRVSVVDGTPRHEEMVGLEEARSFYRRLDDLGVPVLTVPGNHDHRHHADLVEELARVENLHRTSAALEGVRAFGLGSERLDDGPEVRYDPESVTDFEDPDAWLADALERATREEEGDDATGVADELRERIEGFDEAFARYADYRETLRSLAPSASEGETIGVTHVPPFDTLLDRVAESVPRIGGRHWGSIALRNALTEVDVSFLACGHIHEAEGVATVAGTRCLNAGFRSAYAVTIGNGTVSIDGAKPPLE